MPADPALWPQLTARETFDFLARLHGSFDAAYRDELIERFDLDPDKRIRALSTGNRQKVALIAAFMSRAPLLIFDEPTSGLDPLKKVVFRECLAEAKERGQTVLLSSHLLSEVEAAADRVGLLRRGRLVEVGTFAELRHLSSADRRRQLRGARRRTSPALPGVEAVDVTDATSAATCRGRSRRCSRPSSARTRSTSRATSRRWRTSSSRAMATMTDAFGVVFGLAWRRVARGAVIWGAIFALTVVSSVFAYESTYGTRGRTRRAPARAGRERRDAGAVRRGARDRHGARIPRLAHARLPAADRGHVGAARRHAPAARRGGPRPLGDPPGGADHPRAGDRPRRSPPSARPRRALRADGRLAAGAMPRRARCPWPAASGSR